MRAKLTLLTLSLSIGFFACSSGGPKAPDPGTPAFFWGSAKQTFTAGDFLKTKDNLDQALKSAEYKNEGLPWSLVLTGGLIRGYEELAMAFENGTRANKSNPMVLRRQLNDYRTYAKRLALQFSPLFEEFQKTNKDEQIKLAFPYPPGSPGVSPFLSKVASGIAPQQSQIEEMQKSTIQREMIMETAEAAGAGDDATKAQEMFKTSPVSVPRAQFIFAMAKSLSRNAQLFSRKKLDEPDKARMLYEQTVQLLKPLDSKDAKALSDECQKALKEMAKKT